MAEPGQKAQLRASVSLSAPARLSEADLESLGRLVQTNLLAGFPPGRGAKVALYAPVPGEIGTGMIAERVRQVEGHVYYPLVGAEGDMSFHRVDEEAGLVPGTYGILSPAADSRHDTEPVRFDMVVVPGLAFDLNGFRLGRGGGYYDRFLARVEAKIVVGLAFSWRVVPALPVDPWDRPVGAIATEKGVIRVEPISGAPRVWK